MAPARRNDKLTLITDNEEKLALAIQQTRLKDCTEDELKQCLKYCYALVGLRAQNFPTGELKEFLHGFVRQQYGGHTPAEVRLAFEMAVTGKLTADPNCYENFSPLYFASIMNAFRPWAAKTVDQLPPHEKKPTPDEIVDINCEYIAAKLKEINKLPF